MTVEIDKVRLNNLFGTPKPNKLACFLMNHGLLQAENEAFGVESREAEAGIAKKKIKKRENEVAGRGGGASLVIRHRNRGG